MTNTNDGRRVALIGNTSAYIGPPLAPGGWVLPRQGNAFGVESRDGVVLVDTGPGGDRTERMITALREVSDSPVTATCSWQGVGQ